MTSIPAFDFSAGWVSIIQLLIVIVLPTVVGLVTDRLSASWVKALILAALAAATTLLTSLLDAMMSGAEFDWVNAVGTFIVSVGVAQLSYLGLLKPWGVIDKAQGSNVIQFVGPSEARIARDYNFEEKRAA